MLSVANDESGDGFEFEGKWRWIRKQLISEFNSIGFYRRVKEISTTFALIPVEDVASMAVEITIGKHKYVLAFPRNLIRV